MKKLVKYITPVANERKKVNYMKFLTKTMHAVKDYASAIQAARNEFEAAKGQILSTYKDPVATQKLGEAREALSAFEMKEKYNAREAIQKDFEAVRKQVNEFVMVPVSADFGATLEALKSMQNISDSEANAFIEKYKDNYISFRAVLDELHKAGKAADIRYCAVDYIETKLSDLENMLLNWVQSYVGNGYYTALLTSEEHTPILKVAEEVEAFIAGGYILK